LSKGLVAMNKKRKKIKKVMREYSKGKLKHGGSGDTVKRKDIALAIAHSEAGKRKRK
jgi:hypothetical protein